MVGPRSHKDIETHLKYSAQFEYRSSSAERPVVNPTPIYTPVTGAKEAESKIVEQRKHDTVPQNLQSLFEQEVEVAETDQVSHENVDSSRNQDVENVEVQQPAQDQDVTPNTPSRETDSPEQVRLDSKF